MGLLKDFRDFAMKGNVVDLAVGVIVGVAFGNVVNSLVKDVIMPPIGKLVGNMDFSNLYIPLYKLPPDLKEFPKTLADAQSHGSVIAYGNFITITINFLIVAFSIFLVVKMISVMQKKFEKEKAAEAVAAPPADVVLLTEIQRPAEIEIEIAW